MIDNILSMIQRELKSPKDKDNKFGGFKYRKAEDILAAAKPLLAKHECSLLLDTDISLIGERYYVKATATLKKGEAQISVSAYAREEETKKGMDGSQITGSATSYARKYALAGLFAIDDEDDADTPTREDNRQYPIKNNAPKSAPLPNKTPAEFANSVFNNGYIQALNDESRLPRLFDVLARYITQSYPDLAIPAEKDKDGVEFMFAYLVSLEPNKISKELKAYLDSSAFGSSPFETPASKDTHTFLEEVQEAIVVMEAGGLDSRQTANFIKKWMPIVSKRLGRSVSMDTLKDGLYELSEILEKEANNG